MGQNRPEMANHNGSKHAKIDWNLNQNVLTLSLFLPKAWNEKLRPFRPKRNGIDYYGREASYDKSNPLKPTTPPSCHEPQV